MSELTEKAGGPSEARLGLWARLGHTLSQRPFVRKVAVLTGATAAAQGLLVLASPLLTRLYSPSDFGVLSVFASITAILLVDASLRYENAILLPAEEETAASVLALCLFVLLVITFVSAIGIWLLAGPIVRWFNAPALKHYLWLLPIGLFGAGIYQVFSFWVIRKRVYGRLGRSKVYQSVGQIITQVVLGASKVGPVGLLLGDAAGRVIGSGALMRSTWRQDRAAMKHVSFATMKCVARRYRRFPLLSGTSALLNTASAEIPGLLLASFYGPKVLGWFFLAQRVAGVPLNLLGLSVAQVYVAEAARMAHTSPKKIEALFWKTLKSMVLIGIPLVVLLWTLSPLLFSVAFGNKWTEAGIYLRALSMMFLLQFASVWTGGTLDVLERQDLHLVREVATLVLMAGAIIFAWSLDQSALRAVIFLGTAGTVSYLFYGFISWRAIRDVSHRSES